MNVKVNVSVNVNVGLKLSLVLCLDIEWSNGMRKKGTSRKRRRGWISGPKRHQLTKIMLLMMMLNMMMMR